MNWALKYLYRRIYQQGESGATTPRAVIEESWRLPNFPHIETSGPIFADANFSIRRQNVSGEEATLAWEKLIAMAIHHAKCATLKREYVFLTSQIIPVNVMVHI